MYLKAKPEKRGSDTSGCFVAGIVRGAFPCQVAICPPEREPGGEIVFMMIIAAIILIIMIIMVMVIIFIIITSMDKAIPNFFDKKRNCFHDDDCFYCHDENFRR